MMEEMLLRVALLLSFALMPALMLLLVRFARILGPNAIVGFRLSPRMRDRSTWDRVHRDLQPLLIRQSLIGTVVGVVLVPSVLNSIAFIAALLALVLFVFVVISRTIRLGFRILERNE